MRTIHAAVATSAKSLAFLLSVLILLCAAPGPAEAACPPGSVAGPGGTCMTFRPPPVACPGGQVRNGAGQCVPNTAGPAGNVVRCPGNQILLASGICGCPPGTNLTASGNCLAPVRCPQNQVNVGGQCKCPSDKPIMMPSGVCIPYVPICPPTMKLVNGKCVPK